MARRIEFDLDYIRYWSPALDLKIILLTIPRMLRDPAAY
jgi:putative colanic acid biosynthesis UDP-glucose lipid carrier transferase